MDKSHWLPVTAILALGAGFGHAGCYTSGTPGGLGAGGSQPSGGTTSQDASAGASNDAADSSGNSLTCQENLDCADSNNGNLVCRTDLGQCVQCNVDADCQPSSNSNVLDANLASDMYCYQNACISLLKCQRNSDCKGLADTQICDLGHCVQCAIDADCAAIGGVGPNCAGHVCRTPCQSVIQCNALNSQINLDCAQVSSTLSLCTESCTASAPSDCYPGNTCSSGFCVPSS